MLVLSLGYGSMAQPGQTGPLSQVGVVNVMKVLQTCKRNTDHIAEAQAEGEKLTLELRTLAQELDVEKAQLKTFVRGTDDYLAQAKLVGAKQNRIVNTTILIQPKSTTVIPVSCVEQGRWSYDSPHFFSQKRMMSPGLRAMKARQVHESVRTSGNWRSEYGCSCSQCWSRFYSLWTH